MKLKPRFIEIHYFNHTFCNCRSQKNNYLGLRGNEMKGKVKRAIFSTCLGNKNIHFQIFIICIVIKCLT